MGKSVTDLKLILENSFGHVYKYDPYRSTEFFSEKIYQETISKKKLKIAYMLGDEFSGVSLPIKNTVIEVKDYLIK